MKIGIIGSGQLGYMMINTMRRYPIEFYVIDDNKGPSASIADKFFLMFHSTGSLLTHAILLHTNLNT